MYDSDKILTDDVCFSLVEVIKSLIGAPPDYYHIVAVMDCLILLHPVTTTFITHAKSSFYLLLSGGQCCRPRGKKQIFLCS